MNFGTAHAQTHAPQKVNGRTKTSSFVWEGPTIGGRMQVQYDEPPIPIPLPKKNRLHRCHNALHDYYYYYYYYKGEEKEEENIDDENDNNNKNEWNGRTDQGSTQKTSRPRFRHDDDDEFSVSYCAVSRT
jgi:hypothetical protein